MVQHWITMQKVAGSSLLGVTFAMNRQYFSYTIGKSLHVRVFCSTEESNIIGKILSPHHFGSINKLGQQTKYSTPEQFNLRHLSSVSNLSVNFFHSGPPPQTTTIYRDFKKSTAISKGYNVGLRYIKTFMYSQKRFSQASRLISTKYF